MTIHSTSYLFAVYNANILNDTLNYGELKMYVSTLREQRQ